MIEEILKKNQLHLSSYDKVVVIKEYLKEIGEPAFPIEMFVDCNYHFFQNPHLLMQYQQLANGNGIDIAYYIASQYFIRKMDIPMYTLIIPGTGQVITYTDLKDGNPV